MSLNYPGPRRGTRTPRRADRDTRLRLECLEDRSVPAVFTVNTTLDEVVAGNGKLSLREAISAANSAPGADTIVLPAGVFKIITSGAGEDNNAMGDFDITGGVTIQGAGAGLTIVDGQQLDRVFDVSGSAPSSIKVVMLGLTVRNGKVTGSGGGVQVENADLVVRDCAVTGNRVSQAGGGISNAAAPGTGDVRVVRTTVARNVAGSNGGGLAVLVSSLTVRDSTVRRNLATASGGGIVAATTTLTNCTISGNTTASGGGGGIVAATATLTNCTVSGNTASVEGGGIRANTSTLINSTVSGNSAGAEGGGIAAATVTLTGSTVSGNSADTEGGGINANTATLTNSTVSGNTTAAFGGGIRAITSTLINSTVSGNTAGTEGGGIWGETQTLTRSTVSGNRAATTGGGIRASEATLTNSTVSGNSAGNDGGGIFANTATLLNVTVVENSAHTGGGVFHAPGGAFSVKNTIIALNLVAFTGTGPDVSGAFTSQGHNLIGVGTGGTGFANGVDGDIVGTGANPIDPKLGPLANNGGKTKTHALKAGSRAIDAGDNANVPATDQRGLGFPRQKDGNGDGVARVDIGAFER